MLSLSRGLRLGGPSAATGLRCFSGAPAAIPPLPAHMRPQHIGGKWHKPKYSARQIAVVRQQTLMAGLAWPYDTPKTVRKGPGFDRPNKGHKHEREKEERQKMIAKALEEMPAKVAAHKATMREARQARAEKKKVWLLGSEIALPAWRLAAQNKLQESLKAAKKTVKKK